jgi:hypothetical protein
LMSMLPSQLPQNYSTWLLFDVLLLHSPPKKRA